MIWNQLIFFKQNLFVFQDEIATEVEYIDNYKENVIPKVINIGFTSKNISESNNTESNNNATLQELIKKFSDKNVYRLHNDTGQASTSKLVKKTMKGAMNLTNDENVSIENSKKETLPKKKKTKALTKTLTNTVEVSTNLNNIYEKTYELKKNYITKLEYLKRFAEAGEKIADAGERIADAVQKINMRFEI